MKKNMSNYFMISEFARLRDININSLRYYEKLGLLKPAYIDEETNYRYYSAEQVPVLNKILLCINLGIPLKEMVTYIDEDGNLQSQKLLERGREVALKRMEQMQNNLHFIEYSLNSIEGNKEFADRKGLYEREFEERRVIVTPYHTERLNPRKMISEVGEVYRIAQKEGLFPVLPAGQIWEIDSTGIIRYCFFLEIMNGNKKHGQIRVFPKGKYSCLQVELEEGIDLPGIVNGNWGNEGVKTIIADNVMLEKYSFHTRPSELQKPEDFPLRFN